MENSLPIYTVDAFTDKAFSGNPAAVCPLIEPLPDAVCQKIAFELNLSETAFILQLTDGGNLVTGSKFGLRWFTPTIEVALCGHATLSAAHILFHEFKNTNSIITFETISGDLRCSKTDDGSIQLDFPEWKVQQFGQAEIDFYAPLIKECIGDLPLHALWYADKAKKLIIVLDEKVDRYIFESLKPNTEHLHQFDPTSQHVQGLCITMKGTQTNGFVDEKGNVYHFVSRYFGPWTGIPEDPVTGSMHCALAPLWSKLLGEKNFYARQCSPRGGILKIELRGDGRVYIRGKAVTVISGQINF